MIRLIVFDFDGTLGDTRANIVLTMTQTLRRLGYRAASEAEIASTIGLPLEDGFAKLIPGLSREDILTCAATYRTLFDENRKSLVPSLFPEVKETLARLKELGLTMTVASSRLSKSLLEFLHDMGVETYFSYVLGADNVTRAKPHPEPVLKTLEALGFAPEETLVVGDMPVDILMGRNAGAATCAVTYGNASREELAAAGADWIIDRFSGLLPVVRTLTSN